MLLPARTGSAAAAPRDVLRRAQAPSPELILAFISSAWGWVMRPAFRSAFTWSIAAALQKPGTSTWSPVTVTVVDSSTSINCGITSWLWTWGDGTTTLGKVPGPHTYGVPNPNGSGYYNITLKVTNAAGSTTSGGVQIAVKP